MAAGLWLLTPWLAPLPFGLDLVLLIAAGGLGFLLFAQLLGATDLGEIRGMLTKQRA